MTAKVAADEAQEAFNAAQLALEQAHATAESVASEVKLSGARAEGGNDPEDDNA